MSSALTDMLGNNLVTKDGVKATSDVLNGKKVIGIYFSAHWCPPCRAFTPHLATLYEDLVENVKDLEIVFVSSDRDEASYNQYYGEMPWTAVPLERSDIKAALSSKFAVRSIPTLVFVDQNGTILTAEGRTLAADSSDPTALWTKLQSFIKN